MKKTRRTLVRGDSIELGVEVFNFDKTERVITGAVFRFTAKTALTDANSAALIGPVAAGTLTTPLTGKATVKVPASASEDVGVFTDGLVLFYDIEMEELDGTVTTIELGTLTIQADVSRE